ncbi:hypothetical protein [Nannocystis pusilla]|uniref:hypothetical protein n=1 Tax=Nannocystis pusilla TaxID=889268 RepID=UPI003B75D660
MEFEREGEIVPALPAVLGQERRACGEIRERRGVRGRPLGALARDEVELGDLLSLRRRGDQRGAPVELVHDLEDLLRELFGGHARGELPAGPEVHRRPLAARDERIGRLLDAIVEEFVRAGHAEDEPCLNGLREGGLRVLLRAALDQRQVGILRGVSQTRELLQRLLGRWRQPLELPDHQLDHVVGEALLADLRDVPAERSRAPVEPDQAFFAERVEELDGEEGVAGRLLVDQRRERRGLFRSTMERIGEEHTEVLLRDRAEHDVRDADSRPPRIVDGQQERVEGVTSLSRKAPTTRMWRTSA